MTFGKLSGERWIIPSCCDAFPGPSWSYAGRRLVQRDTFYVAISWVNMSAFKFESLRCISPPLLSKKPNMDSEIGVEYNQPM